MRTLKKPLSGFSILEMMVVFMVIGVMSMAAMQGKKLIRRSKIQHITQIIANIDPTDDKLIELERDLKRISSDLTCEKNGKNITIQNNDHSFFSTEEAERIQKALDLSETIINQQNNGKCSLKIPITS